MSNFPPKHEVTLSPQESISLEVQRIFRSRLTRRSNKNGTYIKKPDYNAERAFMLIELAGDLPENLKDKSFWVSTDGSLLKYRENEPKLGNRWPSDVTGPAHIALVMEVGEGGLQPIEAPITFEVLREGYIEDFEELTFEDAAALEQVLKGTAVLRRACDD